MFALQWYCWLRIDEVESLKMGDLISIDEEMITYVDKTELISKFSKIILRKRKTDQKGTGTIYELHDSLEEPEVYVNTKIVNWIRYR